MDFGTFSGAIKMHKESLCSFIFGIPDEKSTDEKKNGLGELLGVMRVECGCGYWQYEKENVIFRCVKHDCMVNPYSPENFWRCGNID